jgi:hypothetical protein
MHHVSSQIFAATISFFDGGENTREEETPY